LGCFWFEVSLSYVSDQPERMFHCRRERRMHCGEKRVRPRQWL